MSEVANIPQLRFSEFSGEWEEKKLGELCKFTQGVQIPFSEQLTKYKEGAIRYLYIRDFFTDDFPYYVKDQYPNKVIHTDEIMMVNTGNTAGKAFMGATGVLSNNAFKVSFDKTKVSNIFLFQRITSDTIQRRIKSFFNAGGQPHLGHKNIAIIPMGFASLKEQQKIAAFLTAVDNKIEQLSKKKALLGEYKKGLMQQIFSQAIRFKANDGSDFPDWEEKKLGDLSVVISDGNYGELYPTSSDFKLTGVPFLRANNIKSLKIDGTDTKYITEEQHSLLTSGHLQTNDILITTRGVLGNLAIVESTHNGSNINAQICLLRVTNTSELNHFYLLFVLDHRDSKKQYKAFETGTALKQLPKGNLRKIKLKLPTLFEQNKIANFLSSIDTKIEQVDKQLDESKQFKKALLQQMFV